MRTILLNTISDIITDFLYYHRKEDESLPKGQIEEWVKSGAITVDEIIQAFANELRKNLP